MSEDHETRSHFDDLAAELGFAAEELVSIKDTLKKKLNGGPDPYPNSNRGESGESGENPRNTWPRAWRKNGEWWRIFDEFATFEPPRYPIDALGPLAEVARAIAEGGQIEPAMAGQSVLAVAALLAQSRANVMTLAGLKPLSLFMLTIGDSGDGKTTGEDTALRPVRNYQKMQSTHYRHALDEWEQACFERKRKDAKPPKPREPYLIMRDGTVEGIRRGFAEGLPTQGVYTSEAAVMLGGWGMNRDNRAKSAGAFNLLWDDGELSINRALTGKIQLYDRRLSLHWMVQPDAASQAIQDPLLLNMGFWARFLCAWPAPNKPRTAKPFKPEQDPRIGAFWGKCTELLKDPFAQDCAQVPVLEPEPRTHSFINQFFERMEQAAKTCGGHLEPVKPFALRATEQLFRIAGVLSIYSGKSSIDIESIGGAAELVTYSLDTWLGIFGLRQESTVRSDAKILLGWILKQPDRMASETAILRLGPRPTRLKHRRDGALACLEQVSAIERRGFYWSIKQYD